MMWPPASAIKFMLTVFRNHSGTYRHLALWISHQPSATGEGHPSRTSWMSPWQGSVLPCRSILKDSSVPCLHVACLFLLPLLKGCFGTCQLGGKHHRSGSPPPGCMVCTLQQPCLGRGCSLTSLLKQAPPQGGQVGFPPSLDASWGPTGSRSWQYYPHWVNKALEMHSQAARGNAALCRSYSSNP